MKIENSYSRKNNSMVTPVDAIVTRKEHWVNRGGRAIKRHWVELSATERQHAIEAARRATEVAMFNPCGL